MFVFTGENVPAYISYSKENKAGGVFVANGLVFFQSMFDDPDLSSSKGYNSYQRFFPNSLAVYNQNWD